MTKLIVVSSLLVALGCNRESAAEDPSAKPTEAAPELASKDSEKLAPEAASNSKKTTPTASSATNIPPLDLAMVDKAKVKLARSKNKGALSKQKAGDYAGAIALYREALVADPGHILARYNLASAYSLSGKSAEALAQLQQFSDFARKHDCFVCGGRLVRATRDPDFDALKDNDDFVRLSANVRFRDVNTKEAAQLALKAIAKNEFPASLVHPRNGIKLTSVNGNCDPSDGDDCTTKTTIAGIDAVTEFFGESFPVPVAIDSCNKLCCKTKAAPDAEIGDVSMTVSELCFATDSGMAITVTSMSIQEG